MIFLSMCAKYLVQTPSIASKNALVCAMACPWAAHGKPWPAHGMPWCVPRQVMRVPNLFLPVQTSQIVLLNSLYDTWNVSHASTPTHYRFSIFYEFLYFFN